MELFDDKAFIASKIKQARKKNMFTQEKLAEIIGITAKQVSRIENQDYIPSLPTFLKIAKALEIDINDFGLDYIPDENPLRNKLLKIIYEADEQELQFYYNLMNCITNNLWLIKRN